jgi:Mrp family chromosome partitioning ATPase
MKVGVLDADVTGPSIPKLLGVRNTPMGTPDGIIPCKSAELGIRVMSVNLILDDPAKPVVWRGPLIGNVLKQFWEDVNWGELDVLLVDLPPGTADAPLTVMQVMPLDGFVVVTSPQGLASLIVEKACNMARMMNIKLLGLIENMSYAVCPDCGRKMEIFGPSHAEEVAGRFDVPLVAQLPIDTRVAILGDAGRLEEYDEASVLDPIVDGQLASLEEKVPVED